MTWIDDLVPASHGGVVLENLARIVFTDGGSRLSLGPADQATLGLLHRVLERPGANLLLQLPRGRHDVAILCGLFAQLARLVAAYPALGDAPVLDGPVVVIGMNTLVHERLGRIRIGGVPLADGLATCRLRSDGRIVDRTGVVLGLRRQSRELLYLNTRIGWPKLQGGVQPAVVVIDRTSFASIDLLERAMAWANMHQARTTIVVADVGDELTEQAVTRCRPQFLVWPWSSRLLAELSYEVGTAPATTPLSTNVLCRESFEPVHAACFSAVAVDSAFRVALRGLAAARRVDAPWPRPLQLARRLAYGLAQLFTTVDDYNQWAALDHRATALSSLQHELEGRGHDDFQGAWAAYGETRWPELRRDVLDLYRLVGEENPKLFALAFTLEQVSATHRGIPVIIRVPNEAAAGALSAVLKNLLPQHVPDGTAIQCLAWSERLPWTARPLVEIHPAMPPPSRLATLWSAEATHQVYVLYPFELESANAALARGAQRQEAALQNITGTLRIGNASREGYQRKMVVDFTFDVDRRSHPGQAAVAVDLDTNLLFDDVPDAPTSSPSASDPSELSPSVMARPVILQPDGEWWWIKENDEVEVLIGDRMVYLPVGELHQGHIVAVPRGDGREALFDRLVDAAHRRNELQAYEVLFRRWRDACNSVYDRCGTWQIVEERLREKGSTVTKQSPRMWAAGTAMGPDDPEDIARIGVLANDTLIEQQYRRLDAMLRQVRGLHARLGRLLSAAMTEALHTGGPNLAELTKLLGTDPSEILDEFELRAVRSVGPQRLVAVSDIRRKVASVQ